MSFQSPARVWFVLLVFVLLAILYAYLMPPIEYADEPQHLAYARWLAEGKGLPPQGTAAWDTPLDQEAGQPPLYYLVSAVPMRLVMVLQPGTLDQWPLLFRPNPTYNGSHTRYYADNNNIALHYPTDIRPLRGEWLALYLMRGVTILFGLLLLIAVYKLAGTIFPGRPSVALTLTLLVAFIPQVILMSSVVSNDIPAAALSTIVLWQLAALLRDGASPRRGLILGLCLGLALLVKVSTLALLSGVVLGYAWLFWRNPAADRHVIRVAALLTTGAALIVAGWWYARNWVLYGVPLGLNTHDNAPWAYGTTNPRPDVWERWGNVFNSFWASIGWGPVEYSPRLYWLLAAVALSGLIGLVVIAVRHWQRDGGRFPATLQNSPVPILIIIFSLTLIVIAAELEVWMQELAADFGRLLFPAIAPVMFLLFLGWRAIHPRLPGLVGALLGVLAVATPFILIRPTYHPRPLPAAQIVELSPSLGWHFAIPSTSSRQIMAELISARPLQAIGHENMLLPVEVCYRALSAAPENYVIFIHLVGPENWIPANRYSVPGLGTYPTVAWQPGDVLCDRLEVRIWGNLDRSLVYQLEVGFLTADHKTRLSATDMQGNPLPFTFAGQVKLEADETVIDANPPGDQEPIDLLRADVPAFGQPGETISFTLFWEAIKAVNADYQVFVHLRDAGDGRLVAQADGPPVGGWYGTSWWTVREIVADERQFILPPETPPGQYDLVVGLYDLTTGERINEEEVAAEITVRSPTQSRLAP
jgi:hypothetical protein